MTLRRTLLFLCLPRLFAQAPLPALNDVLRRVAENQEKAVAARLSIVYTQEIRTRSVRNGGKLAREEKRRYTVTPTATSTEKKLDFFEGQYMKGGTLIPYSDPKFRYKDMDIDGDLVASMTDNMINGKESRDGIPKDLFPLTALEQEHYTYRDTSLPSMCTAGTPWLDACSTASDSGITPISLMRRMSLMSSSDSICPWSTRLGL